MKKLFSIIATFALLATTFVNVPASAAYSAELEEAYGYAYGMGITTMTSIDNADMYGTLTRVALAKMISNYVIELGLQTADTSKECKFTDVSAALDAQYGNWVTNACQLGLMGVGISSFRPFDTVTRAEFGTVLSRAIWGDANNGSDPYYTAHLNALKDEGIMTMISNPNMKEVRGYVMLMMQRADEEGVASGKPAICSTPENILACSLDLDSCPAECMQSEDENAEPVEVKLGKLNVTMENAGVGWDVPHSITALPVVTYKFTADEDINVTALTLEQVGFGTNNTISNAALFIDGKRVSSVRNLDINTKRVINLSNAYTVKKGGSVNIEVRATLGNVTEQFAVRLTEVSSSAKDTVLASNITSNTFKVVGTVAATLTFDDRTAVEAPKVWVTNADIFEFNMNNTTLLSKQDIKLYTITLMWVWAEARNFGEYLKNLKLVVDNNVLASAEMDGKYITFKISNWYLIEKDKTPTFTIRADVVGGAWKTVDFTVEDEMDVVAISQTHNSDVKTVVTDDSASSIGLLAGKVTIERTNPVSLDFVKNRKNVFLWSFDIINNAGGSIRLEDFIVEFAGLGWTVMANTLESVKVRFWSTTAGLVELDSNVDKTEWISDNEMSIGSKLTVYVYADIADSSMVNKSFQAWIKLNSVIIRETQNDVALNNSDISYPAKWATMNGKEGELTLTKVFLPNKSFSKGTADIDALSFKLKAGVVYGAKVKKFTFTAAWVNTNTVRTATLYNWTTAIPATVSNWEIRVTTPITINANETANFVLKIDLASNPIVSPFTYSLLGANIEVEDTSADRNTITVWTDIAGREITVETEGTVTLSYEANATSNKSEKSILAWNPAVIAEYNVKANYEKSKVRTITVTFNKPVKDSLGDLELNYSGTIVASSPTWDVAWTIATFSNLNVDLLTEESILTVKAISTVINSNGGSAVKAAQIAKIAFTDVLGKDSGNEITVAPLVQNSREFDIVPAVIIASVKELLATSATLALTVDRGSNETNLSAQAKATLDALNFTVLGNNGGLDTFRVEKEDGTVVGTYGNAGDQLTFNTQLLGQGENILKVYFTQAGAINTPSYTVRLNGVDYTTNATAATVFSNRMPSTLNIISK